jgi:hypothetical protein
MDPERIKVLYKDLRSETALVQEEFHHDGEGGKLQRLLCLIGIVFLEISKII